VSTAYAGGEHRIVEVKVHVATDGEASDSLEVALIDSGCKFVSSIKK